MKFKLGMILVLGILLMAGTSYAASPERMAGDFLEMVQEKKVNEAFEMLFEGSVIQSTKTEAVEELKTSVLSKMDQYGNVVGSEIILRERISKTIFRVVGVLEANDLPIVFDMYFYKPNGDWRLINISMNDRVDLIKDLN